MQTTKLREIFAGRGSGGDSSEPKDEQPTTVHPAAESEAVADSDAAAATEAEVVDESQQVESASVEYPPEEQDVGTEGGTPQPAQLVARVALGGAAAEPTIVAAPTELSPVSSATIQRLLAGRES